MRKPRQKRLRLLNARQNKKPLSEKLLIAVITPSKPGQRSLEWTGSWWGDVAGGTRNSPIPLRTWKDSTALRKGFIGSAGSMVSDTAIGAARTQIIGIASIDGVNRLTGGRTPEWMTCKDGR